MNDTSPKQSKPNLGVKVCNNFDSKKHGHNWDIDIAKHVKM